MKKISKSISEGVMYSTKLYQFLDVSKLSLPTWVTNQKAGLKDILERPEMTAKIETSVDLWQSHNEALLAENIEKIEVKATNLLEYAKPQEKKLIEQAKELRIKFLENEAEQLDLFGASFKDSTATKEEKEAAKKAKKEANTNAEAAL